jgi:hypothetical protein
MDVTLKPQDLLTTLALTLPRFQSATWTYSELASTLGLSVSEANAATRRAAEAGLVTSGAKRGAKPRPVRRAVLEFVDHGVRYAFFVHPGESTRGTPTAHSAPPLSALLDVSEEAALVWPDAKGKVRGQAVTPLYPTVPHAVRAVPALHEILALVDALRVGRARERELASRELAKRIIGEREH